MRPILACILMLWIEPGRASPAVNAVPLSRPLPDSTDVTAPGEVDVSFDIEANGVVDDVKVEARSPTGLYDQRALAAVSNWRYQPRFAGGHAVRQPANRIVLHFEPAASDPQTALMPMFDSKPDYPRAAFLKGIEGWATVEFSVNELGLVDASHIVSASPAGVFDQAALTDINERHYLPPTENDKPVRVSRVVETVSFRLAQAEIAPTRTVGASVAYPPMAEEMGIEGSCAVRMHIADDGSVDDIVILGSAPTDIFDTTCRQAGLGMRFRPPFKENSQHVSRIHTLNINFRFSGSSSFNGRQERLLHPGQWMKIGFDLRRDGTVIGARMIAADCSDSAARRILELFRGQQFAKAGNNEDAAKRRNLIKTFVEPTIPPSFPD